MANGNPYAVSPAGDMTQGLAGLSNVLANVGEQRQQRELAEQEAAAQRQQQQAIQAAIQSGDPDQYAEAVAMYPDAAGPMMDAVGLREDYQKEDKKNFLLRVLTNPGQADQLYQERIQQLEAQGRDPTHTINSYELYQQDPEMAMRGNRMALADISPDAYKAFQDSMAQPDEDRPTPYTDIGKITSDLQTGLIDEEQAGNLIEQAARSDGEGDQRDRKIASLANMLRGAEGIENPEELATKWHDGVLDVEVLDSGQVRLIDGEAVLRGEREKAVYELPISSLAGDAERPQPTQTIYELADEAAGVAPFAQEVWGRIAGQVGLPAPENVSEARQFVRGQQQNLIRALMQGRYTEGQAKRLDREINMGPSAFDSPESFRERATANDEILRIRLQQEQMAADDPSLPSDTREKASAAANAIQNYLDVLGVPQSVDETTLTPDFIGEMNPNDARDMVRNRLSDEQINNLSDEQYNLLMEKVRGQ